MRIMLQERGIDTTTMKVADMWLALGSHVDFKNEKTALEHVVQEKQQRAIYLPNFHCELTPLRGFGEKPNVI